MRDAIVREAITWLGTPFRDCQRVKGHGVDCGMLPLDVFAKLGLIPDFNPGHYSTQIHLHKTDEEQRREGLKPYIDFVREHLRQVDESDVGPGDLVLYVNGKCFSHSAIIIDWPHKIIHAKVGLGVVFDDPLRNGKLMRRKHEFYTAIGAANV